MLSHAASSGDKRSAGRKLRRYGICGEPDSQPEELCKRDERQQFPAMIVLAYRLGCAGSTLNRHMY
jgi:hypothetical protein